MATETRAGMIAIIGLPNAGKSSLMNRLLGSKLSIVTAAAQTTRQRVVGIDTRDGVQMIFLDTPGIMDPAHLLHRSMLTIVDETIGDADVVVLLLDGTRSPPELPEEIVHRLSRIGERLVIAINKADIANRKKLDVLHSWSLTQLHGPAVETSAETGAGVDELRERIAGQLPLSPLLYPDDDVSTQTVRFFVTELIREAVFERFEAEVPYSTVVAIDEFRESGDPLFIRATVFVERASQKGILIGQKGRSIRELGSSARAKIESFVGRRVYLDLWIKVLPKWRKDPTQLRRFGFPVPDRTDA